MQVGAGRVDTPYSDMLLASLIQGDEHSDHLGEASQYVPAHALVLHICNEAGREAAIALHTAMSGCRTPSFKQ